MPKLARIPVAALASADVQELARKVVKQRVRAAVSYWKRVAEHKSPRVHDIHQLRVWSRRVLAALQLFAPVLPTEPANLLGKTLNKARKQAGKARDGDVLKQTLDKHARKTLRDFLDLLGQQRQEAVQKLKRSYGKKGKSGHVREYLKGVLAKKSSAAGNRRVGALKPFGPWFRKQFSLLAASFRQQLRASKPTQANVHALRIEGKRVRYALEIGLPSLPQNQGPPLYAALAQLQQWLGEICDDLALADRYREFAQSLKPGKQETLNAFIHQHNQRAKAGMATLVRWWQAPSGRKHLLMLLAAVATAKQPSTTRAPAIQRRTSHEK